MLQWVRSNEQWHLGSGQLWFCFSEEMVSEFSQSQSVRRKSTVFPNLFWSALQVSSVTHCMNISETPTKISPPHCNHRSTTRIIQSKRFAVRSERGGFPKGCRPHQRVYQSRNTRQFTFVLARHAAGCCFLSLGHYLKKNTFSTPSDHLRADEFARRWTSCTTTLLFPLPHYHLPALGRLQCGPRCSVTLRQPQTLTRPTAHLRRCFHASARSASKIYLPRKQTVPP